MVQIAGFLGITTGGFLQAHTFDLARRTRAGMYLLQRAGVLCSMASGGDCRAEEIHAIALLATLTVLVTVLACAFAFLREDKEEMITPLCPSLLVRGPELNITLPKMPTFEIPSECIVVAGSKGDPFCKVVVEWPRQNYGGASVLAARLMTNFDVTLATLDVRDKSAVGQSMALCRGGCDIFGYVTAEGPHCYTVRHRASIPFLTLMGDFGDNLNVLGTNPVGTEVCWFKWVDGEYKGKIFQHVDAGLVICSLLAARVDQRLRTTPLPPWAVVTPRSAVGPEEPCPEPATAGGLDLADSVAAPVASKEARSALAFPAPGDADGETAPETSPAAEARV